MSIYEHVPNGYEGPANLLRSRPHPPRKAYVRFINTSNTSVTVKWVDFDGNLKTYRTLKENEYFDCDTFQDHAWVFRECPTHDPMHVANQEVFWPKSAFVTGNYIQKRSSVRIHRPMLSLLTLAARTVRDKLKFIIEPFSLEIPFLLQTLVVRLMLKCWEASPELRLNTPMFVPEDPENIILKADFDDFHLNILFISYRLSLHAKKLLQLARNMKGSGDVRATLIGTLELIIIVLGYDLQCTHTEIYSRKLAPVIWKQIIFLRVHIDTLLVCCGPGPLERNHSYYYNLRKVVEKRRQNMPLEHRNSLQRYHWEQLSLLVGDPAVEDKRSKEDPAYDIPEIVPLAQRTEWEWIDLRRNQLMDHPDDETVNLFIGLTTEMLSVTSRLENIFQILGFFHFQLTGQQLTDEDWSDEDKRYHTAARN